MPFEWKSELDKIENSIKQEQVSVKTVVQSKSVSVPKQVSVSTKTSAPVKATATVQSNPAQNKITVPCNAESFKVAVQIYMRVCLECGVGVWIGKEGEVPRGVKLACPHGSDWTDNAEPYCDVCWKKESELLDGMTGEHKAIGPQKAAAKKKAAAAKKKAAAAKKKAAAAKKKAAAAKKKASAKKKTSAIPAFAEKGAVDENTDAVDETPTFKLGSNVLAKWGRSWYLSHVCAVRGLGQFTQYDVYCPVQDSVKKNLDSTTVRVFDNPHVPSRVDCVKDNVTFWCDGEIWKVRSVTHEKNQFTCVRVSDGGTGPNMDNFEVGYVIREIREEYEKRRERGPMR